MIYMTADIHRDRDLIFLFCEKMQTTKADILIILGDACIDVYLDEKDKDLKQFLENLPITLFCIHGNHEERAENVKNYEEAVWHGATVYVDKDYPSILMAKDGEIYDFNGLKTIVLGGAYSPDKDIRWWYGGKWFESEQLSKEERASIEKKLEAHDRKVDVVLSHAAPKKHEPREAFLPGFDQSEIEKEDVTTGWLNEIEEQLDYKFWFCGHYHTMKKEGKMQFLYQNFVRFPDENDFPASE